MVVVLRNGDLEVEVCADGDYSPDVVNDLCNRAKHLFTYQHAVLGYFSNVADDDE